jgi:hypothetical protein
MMVLGVALVAGLVLGYSRWRQDRRMSEALPIGDNLASEELVNSLEKESITPNPTVDPQQVISGSGGKVSIYTWEEGDTVYYQLRGEFAPLESGFYAAWLANPEQADMVNLGQFRAEKGGWLLEFQTKGTVNGYDDLMITREFVDDVKPEEVILRGKL